MDQKPQRISNFQGACLIVVALFFDLLSLIPVVNVLVSGLAVLLFGVWFYMLGVGFINPRRFVTAAITYLMETIPFISWLPSLTVAVTAIILMVKSEDKLGIKIPVPSKK